MSPNKDKARPERTAFQRKQSPMKTPETAGETTVAPNRVRDAILPGMLGAIGLITIIGLAGRFGVSKVERHLSADVERNVQTKILGVQVRFDGRDALVSGQVQTAAKLEQLRAQVTQRWGVRTVSVDDVLVEESKDTTNPKGTSHTEMTVPEGPVPTIPLDRASSLDLVPTVPSSPADTNTLVANSSITGAPSTTTTAVQSGTSSSTIPPGKSTGTGTSGVARLPESVPPIPTTIPKLTPSTLREPTPTTRLAQVRTSVVKTNPTVKPSVTSGSVAITTKPSIATPADNTTTPATITTKPTTTTPATTTTAPTTTKPTITTPATTTTATTTTAPTTTKPTTTIAKTTLPPTTKPTTTTVPATTTTTAIAILFDPNIVAAQIQFVLGDQPIEFVDSSVTLRPTASIPLDLIASLLAGAPDARFVIEVHTDGRGAPAKNVTLSKRRGEAIRSALVSRGVATERLLVDGRGETEPISSDATPEGQAANRRVVFAYQPTPVS